ncbi:hypothetical protein AAC387_Pa02g4570 [Persea americana]
MSVLPDEIWSRILEMGVETKGLSYRDMCCISITCRRFHRLSNDHPLWATLLALDFPSPSLPLPSNNTSNIQTTPKSLYKTRFERDRASKLLAHRRAVLIVESQIAICSKNLRDSGLQLLKEKDKMKETVEELANLRKVRQASVALNVWQPEIVRGRQKQTVEQCRVPVEHRIGSLEMELKLCKNQIDMLHKSYNNQKRRLDAGKERLAALKYHPLCDHQVDRGDHDRGVKRKKLKECSNCKTDEKLHGKSQG